MALFWFLAGILSTLAFLILLLPWLRTVPRLGPLPSLPWQAGIAAGLMIAAVLALYHWFGHADLVGQSTAPASAGMPSAPGMEAAAGPAGAAAKSGAGSMSSAVAALEARLQKGGGSAEDWELLAKSYEFLGRPADASQTRARHLASVPKDADMAARIPAQAGAPSAPALSADSLRLLAKAAAARQNKHAKEAAAIYAQLAAQGQMNADSWADYADTAATLQDGKLAGQPESFIAKSLALDARHPKALWLEASADEEAGRLDAAARVWQQLLAVLPADSADAKIVSANLQRATQVIAPAAGSSTAVSGEVLLAAGLSAKAASGATLYIVAKSVDSPGAPVAVFRGSVAAWPVKFTLDDSQSMVPGRNLSSAGRVTIEARISQSGRPMPASGDLQGSSGAINPADHQPLKITIDRIIS